MKLSTLLDVAGLLLLVLAGALVTLELAGGPAALAAAGLGVMGVSWIVDMSERRARK